MSARSAADLRDLPTAPVVLDLAAIALRLLASRGLAEGETRRLSQEGVTLSLTGPSALPDSVPAWTAAPASIPADPAWKETYRLSVHAPLLVFDVRWRDGEPLRIMGFSRGDWEQSLR